MMMNRTLIKKTSHACYALNTLDTLEMLAAKEKQKSISKVRAWLGMPHSEHKTPEADEENPLDMTDMTKSLYVTTQADDNTLTRPMTLSEARKHARNARLPGMQLVDVSVDIFR